MGSRSGTTNQSGASSSEQSLLIGGERRDRRPIKGVASCWLLIGASAANEEPLILTGGHGDVVAAVLFEEAQAALAELALALLGRRRGVGGQRGGALLLDHHHGQLAFQQVDLALGQLLFALLQVLLLNLLLQHHLAQLLLAAAQLLHRCRPSSIPSSVSFFLPTQSASFRKPPPVCYYQPLAARSPELTVWTKENEEKKTTTDLLFDSDIVEHGLDLHLPVLLHGVETLVRRLGEGRARNLVQKVQDPLERRPVVSVRLPANCFIPSNYIPSSNVPLDLGSYSLL